MKFYQIPAEVLYPLVESHIIMADCQHDIHFDYDNFPGTPYVKLLLDMFKSSIVMEDISGFDRVSISAHRYKELILANRHRELFEEYTDCAKLKCYKFYRKTAKHADPRRTLRWMVRTNY